MDNEYKVIKRDGSVVEFLPSKIHTAITKAYIATKGEGLSTSEEIKLTIDQLTNDTLSSLCNKDVNRKVFHIEDIQDKVELTLMRSGDYDVAKAYVIYRENRTKSRIYETLPMHAHIEYWLEDGEKVTFDINVLDKYLKDICVGIVGVKYDLLLGSMIRDMYTGCTIEEIKRAAILSSRTLIETDPIYSVVTARLLLHDIREEVLGSTDHKKMQNLYVDYFTKYIKKGIDLELLDPELATYDLGTISEALVADRDLQFEYIGLQTLYDRYLVKYDGVRMEVPQILFMRVAMGLAMNEEDREEKAIEFYNLLSSFDFMNSTPTLFNSGTTHSQLSSCYLSTIEDSLEGIYEGLTDNAFLSKYAGGLGNDWTNVRAMGSYIKGTNGISQGVIPFLKVSNDTLIAVNQGSLRQGAGCAYLEIWHLDIEEFVELRKNTGDDRRRTHDMNIATWIPDLFMKRVMENKEWTLFTPSEVPDLHDLYGQAFEDRYIEYEELNNQGKIKHSKTMDAVSLWRKILGMLFETGHPWITFKDPCNIRSPQQHTGVVHSSNLCTEITLNTSKEEIAVCNLGSINLANHIVDGKLDNDKVKRTVTTAIRMLDNVIDINFYPVEKARNSNMKHRPIGLGIMGFQDSLHKLNISYASDEAVKFADTSTEMIAYHAYYASSLLAEERGAYSSYMGSLWSKGILPLDTIDLLKKERNGYLEVDTSSTLDWDKLRNRILEHGMRNSNCLAIAPTATIANITGVSASIEPSFQNLYVKSNLSGEFTIINKYLVNELKKLNLWDEAMVADIKFHDGILNNISRIPDHIKHLYVTAFELDTKWIIEAASRRQKWIDQAQSLNIYMAGVSGKKMDDIYKLAWVRGLKTTYYLRALSASNIEKSTSYTGVHNKVSNVIEPSSSCSINDSECESCQ